MNIEENSIAVLILAAGRGTRVQNDTQGNYAKQYLDIAGESLLQRSINLFIDHPRIENIMIALHSDDRVLFEKTVTSYDHPKIQTCIGGESRQESSLRGLEALEKTLKPQYVLIHDAARPFLSQVDLEKLLASMNNAQASLLATPITDTIKQTHSIKKSQVVKTIPRDTLWAAQTPQCFEFSAILSAHKKAVYIKNKNFTDDAEIAEWAGLHVHLVKSSSDNLKITTMDDLLMARTHFSRTIYDRYPDVRVGSGFDVHAFSEGDHIILGGVAIAHTHGLEGHSDADVALHALTDAILGTYCDGDIGTHFPPGDPRWHKVASDIFVEYAHGRLKEAHGMISHVDMTIIGEKPKILPHRKPITDHIASLCDLSPTRINVKATTTEKLGFLGRGEGIAAHVTVTARFMA